MGQPVELCARRRPPRRVPCSTSALAGYGHEVDAQRWQVVGPLPGLIDGPADLSEPVYKTVYAR